MCCICSVRIAKYTNSMSAQDLEQNVKEVSRRDRRRDRVARYRKQYALRVRQELFAVYEDLRAQEWTDDIQERKEAVLSLYKKYV